MSSSNTIKPYLVNVAEELVAAEKTCHAIEPISSTYPQFSYEDAHTVQRLCFEMRQKNGDRLVGYKLGLTSKEAQKQFKVFQPDYGRLMASMEVWDDHEIKLESLIQPRIEGEIAVVMGKTLKGPGVSVVDALRSIDFVTAALEIVDCRMRQWRVGAKDLVADNGASARYVLAPRVCRIDRLSLGDLGMALSENGEVKNTGAGSATMGSPVHAIAFLANQLGSQGLALEPGQLILTGALSAMLTVSSKAFYSCEIQNLGRVTVRFS